MINVTKTYLPSKELYKLYVDQIFESGWITNSGAFVNKLEHALCNYLGVEHLLLVSNGTLALQVCFKALGLTGEVITTPFSFVATTSALDWEKLKPVFADINSKTFNIDPKSVKEKITPNTSAVLPVHVFGNACEVNELESICTESGIKLIFDAAHAFDVKDSKTNVLNYGDASILSFHATKIFHTIEGGAIIFRKKEDYDKAKLMINFGISDYDRVDGPGINCKMNEFQAAMGLAMLPEMPTIIQARKEIWERYYLEFSENDSVYFQNTNPSFNQNYGYFPVVFKNEETLLKVKFELNNNGIYPRRYFYPSLNELNYLEDYQPCPLSENLVKCILCLPIYPGLKSEELEQIISIINKIL